MFACGSSFLLGLNKRCEAGRRCEDKESRRCYYDCQPELPAESIVAEMEAAHKQLGTGQKGSASTRDPIGIVAVY